jgi:hypothetical protein
MNENLDRHRDLLRQAEEALRAVGKAAIVVKTTLDKPYTDAPETTPWKRFMDAPARRAYNLGHEIREFLKNHDYNIGDRVEWNPTGDTWKPGVVTRYGLPAGHVYVRLDENGENLLVDSRHLRRAGGVS